MATSGAARLPIPENHAAANASGRENEIEARRRSEDALPPFAVWAAVVLSVLGIATLWMTAQALYVMWMTDPLKSIGMLVPPVAMGLILWRWRELGWELDGSWWGLALLVGTALAVRFREQSVLVLVLSPRWSVFFPPHSLVVLLYVTGWVLLFGGGRLLRAAWFPVLLMLLVNPVPHIFNVFVDLPLQQVSAHVARAFAIALHQKLTPDQMRLMFTPDFGMFIAPGCNGIRGAVTMGMIALVVGYVYRFRWATHALFVVGAVLLGYVFNFVRLCTLVVYYIVALKIPWLQDRAEMGDYVIGGCLFLFAVWLLFQVVRRAQPRAVAEPRLAVSSVRRGRWNGVGLRLAGMTLLVALAVVRVVHARLLPATVGASAAAMAESFPKQVGGYGLDRSWTEQMVRGPVIYQWADYQPIGAPPVEARSTAEAPDPEVEARSLHVSVGISPMLGAHDVSICHSAHGEDPIWHGELRTATAAGEESFNSSFFNNGATQFLEVTTVCHEGGCGEYMAGGQTFGLIYSRPAPVRSMARDPQRPIPVILRVETLDTAMPAEMARRELTETMRRFLAGVNLEQVTDAYRDR